MMTKFLTLGLLIFFLSTAHAHPAMKRLRYGPDWDYQPILINGEEVYTSRNASGGSTIIQERYAAIKQVLSQYDRPITVLDLGANNGYFSLKIAEDFDACCVLVDGTERLTDICTLNAERNRVIHLQKRFNKADIQELARREHFDVVLALHVLHHVDDWKAWVHTLFALGDNVIIETPSVDDTINRWEHTKQLARYLTSLPSGVEIGTFPRNGVYDHMLLFSQTGVSTGRVGIVPSTFFRFSGAFPTRSYVQELDTRHGKDRWVLQGIDYTLD